MVRDTSSPSLRTSFLVEVHQRASARRSPGGGCGSGAKVENMLPAVPRYHGRAAPASPAQRADAATYAGATTAALIREAGGKERSRAHRASPHLGGLRGRLPHREGGGQLLSGDRRRRHHPDRRGPPPHVATSARRA